MHETARFRVTTALSSTNEAIHPRGGLGADDLELGTVAGGEGQGQQGGRRAGRHVVDRCQGTDMLVDTVVGRHKIFHLVIYRLANMANNTDSGSCINVVT